VIPHDEVNAFVVLDLDEVNHCAGILVKHPQVALAVSDDSQPLVGQDAGLLHSGFELAKLL